jgi:hypothetical protein
MKAERLQVARVSLGMAHLHQQAPQTNIGQTLHSAVNEQVNLRQISIEIAYFHLAAHQIDAGQILSPATGQHMS